MHFSTTTDKTRSLCSLHSKKSVSCLQLFSKNTLACWKKMTDKSNFLKNCLKRRKRKWGLKISWKLSKNRTTLTIKSTPLLNFWNLILQMPIWKFRRMLLAQFQVLADWELQLWGAAPNNSNKLLRRDFRRNQLCVILMIKVIFHALKALEVEI